MSWPELMGLAVGLGCDAFAVAVGLGMRWWGLGAVGRVCVAVGLAHWVMAIVGWWVGAGATHMLSDLSLWVGCGVLVLISLKMLAEARGWDPQEGYLGRIDATRGWALGFMALATSVDVLGAGMAMGVQGARVAGGMVHAAVVIGVVAAGMSGAGMAVGRGAMAVLGRWALVVGAGILLVVAASMASAAIWG